MARSSALFDGRIDTQKPHAPLLFIAGERDHIIPSSLNVKNAGVYSDPRSVVDLQLFKDRSHFICGQRGWQEVADFVLSWLGNKGF